MRYAPALDAPAATSESTTRSQVPAVRSAVMVLSLRCTQPAAVARASRRCRSTSVVPRTKTSARTLVGRVTTSRYQTSGPDSSAVEAQPVYRAIVCVDDARRVAPVDEGERGDDIRRRRAPLPREPRRVAIGRGSTSRGDVEHASEGLDHPEVADVLPVHQPFGGEDAAPRSAARHEDVEVQVVGPSPRRGTPASSRCVSMYGTRCRCASALATAL